MGYLFATVSHRTEMHFLVLCLIYGFQCGVFNSMPFLYYREPLECEIEGIWQICDESIVCSDSMIPHRFAVKDMHSMSMDFNFICAERLTEATIISIGFFGQLTAFTLAVLSELPRHWKGVIIALAALIEGAGLFSVWLNSSNVTWVMVVMFMWNFMYSYLYSQIFAYINETYNLEIRDKAVNILNMFWTCGALSYILYAQIDGNWLHHIAFFSGATVLLLSFPFFILRKKQGEDGEQPEEKQILILQDHSQEAKEMQRSYIQDLIEKFKVLQANRKYMSNAVIYVICWTLITVSYSTPFIAFNSLGGSIQVNVLISVVVDVISSFISFFLLSHFDPLRLLLLNLGITGTLQSLTFFFPPAESSFWITLSAILITKLSTRLGLTTLLTLLPFILPYSFNQLVFNIANVISILFSTLLPFYRFFLEKLGLSIFCGIGFLSIGVLFIASRFRTLEDENMEIKNARKSKDFKKKSSFAPMKRNSDVIIESMLRKSSMITNQAAFLLLDKQSVQEERKYFAKQTAKELDIIYEH